MAYSSAIQLNVELSDLIPKLGLSFRTLSDIVNYARDLRKSGSDIVVEEDLANIFGRGLIPNKFEMEFRDIMNRDIKIQPIPVHKGCEIELKPGPSISVNRAMLEGGGYISTVIQLSFLGWSHSRAELASALVECMDMRVRENVRGAVPHPGSEGIMKSLESCSAQTSSFDWAPIIQDVEGKIRGHYKYFDRPEYRNLVDQQSYRNRGLGGPNARFIDVLNETYLLGAMDNFYIVQRFPGHRKVVFGSEEGAVPIVVWAYKILGLTVAIRSSSLNGQEDLVFGDPSKSPDVIIRWRVSIGSENPQVFLLNEEDEILLTTSPDPSLTTNLETAERHYLENFGTIFLKRHFNRSMPVKDDSPVFKETIELILALVFAMSQKIFPEALSDRVSEFNAYNLESWRTIDAGKVIFKDFWLEIDIEVVGDHVRSLEGQSIDKLDLQPSITIHHLGELKKAGHDAVQDIKALRTLIKKLAFFAFAFSHVENVAKCIKVPLKLSLDTVSSTLSTQLDDGMKHKMRLRSTDLFSTFPGDLPATR